RDVQRECMRHLGKDAQDRVYRTEKNRAVALERISEDRLTKAADAVVRKLHKKPGEALTWSAVKPAHRLREGLETEEIVEAASRAEGVTVSQDGANNGWILKY